MGNEIKKDDVVEEITVKTPGDSIVPPGDNSDEGANPKTGDNSDNGEGDG